jgi:hypothetical protein
MICGFYLSWSNSSFAASTIFEVSSSLMVRFWKESVWHVALHNCICILGLGLFRRQLWQRLFPQLVFIERIIYIFKTTDLTVNQHLHWQALGVNHYSGDKDQSVKFRLESRIRNCPSKAPSSPIVTTRPRRQKLHTDRNHHHGNAHSKDTQKGDWKRRTLILLQEKVELYNPTLLRVVRGIECFIRRAVYTAIVVQWWWPVLDATVVVVVFDTNNRN